MYRLLFVTLGTLVMAGCGQPKLSATPSSLRGCGGATRPSSVSVSWSAYKATQGKPIRLWAHNPDAFGNDQVTLWMEQGPVGTASTGRWVVPGTRITLTDASGMRTLAEIRIGRLACKS
ncbi:hypothetical protein [Rhodanobacter hydrolyticus]|uniref:C-type lysozyme inhibitor domain-containing protein n=1 Tax=Rhodanobacter hydrolyticus TaxID=2250595 RepID=A0ABW8JCE6_9GAMM